MIRRGRAAPPEISEACIVGCEGIVCGLSPLRRLRLGSAACVPGTTRIRIAFIWIIMIQKAGVKNESISVLGRWKGWSDVTEELTKSVDSRSGESSSFCPGTNSGKERNKGVWVRRAHSSQSIRLF